MFYCKVFFLFLVSQLYDLIFSSNLIEVEIFHFCLSMSKYKQLFLIDPGWALDARKSKSCWPNKFWKWNDCKVLYNYFHKDISWYLKVNIYESKNIISSWRNITKIKQYFICWSVAFYSIRQKKLQQQLQDAANEPLQIKNV